MKFQGVIRKMHTEFQSPVKYFMEFDNDFICVNDLIGKEMSVEFIKYQCLCCSDEKEIFRQGF